MIRTFFSLAFFFAAFGQQPTTAWPQENSDLRPHASLQFGDLENGFRYIIVPHPEPPERVSLRLYVVGVGSLAEKEDQRGLAHFLEHMALNGTRQFKSTEIVEFLQRLGMAFGPDINAHTSFDETVYKLDLPNVEAETVKQGLSILRDWAVGMLLDEEEIQTMCHEVSTESIRELLRISSRIAQEELVSWTRGGRL